MKRLLHNRKGIALIVVLWVLALLTVLVAEFCRTLRTEVRIAGNYRDSARAYYIARAGISAAIFDLVGREEKKARAGVQAKERKPKFRINAINNPIPFADGFFTVEIGNESGKININRAGSGLLKAAFEGLGIPEEQIKILVDSILDWRDPDDLHRLFGAEDDYYHSLTPSYECRNGEFETVEELLLVRGVSMELFQKGISGRVTVYPKTGRRSRMLGGRGGGGGVNVNAASEKMLLSFPMIDREIVDQIAAFRREKDIENREELKNLVGADVFGAISRQVHFSYNPYYTIRSTGTLSGSRTKDGLRVMVEIDSELENHYRIVRWMDDLR